MMLSESQTPKAGIFSLLPSKPDLLWGLSQDVFKNGTILFLPFFCHFFVAQGAIVLLELGVEPHAFEE
jgi:hypothetical protein